MLNENIHYVSEITKAEIIEQIQQLSRHPSKRIANLCQVFLSDYTG